MTSTDNRRKSLIEAAAASLAESGVAGTSVRSICARAGVSPGLLTHYFNGIDALIAEAYRDVAGRVARTLADAAEGAGGEPRARLVAFVTASFRPPIAEPSLLASWLAFWSLVKTDEAIAAIHRDTYADYRTQLEDLLRACGLSASAAAPGAIGLAALVDGLWLELTLDPTAFNAAQAEAIAVNMVDGLLRAPSPSSTC